MASNALCTFFQISAVAYRKVASPDESAISQLQSKIEVLRAENEDGFLPAAKRKRLRRIINKVRAYECVCA